MHVSLPREAFFMHVNYCNPVDNKLIRKIRCRKIEKILSKSYEISKSRSILSLLPRLAAGQLDLNLEQVIFIFPDGKSVFYCL